ncbi:MAG: 50S ribosomal protein L25/general stress protein Ctc [Prolixibacteraceae bacterium]|nr:50S ribosomal protein L25/general stress protein Ctc [Prolixibacteraceae bacterium]MBN2650570.1 50S ribosomal protein L25/general stress protein Ctc [Prolixibacteraceae bacterium]
MRTFELEGKIRENVGKKDAKRLRAANQVPCVLYGLEENIHFYVDFEVVRKLIYTPHVYLINLNLDGKTYQSVMQDIQYHPVTDAPLHIDFLKTSDDKPVKVNIPVVTSGFAKGIRAGGRLQVEMRRLWVSALPKDLPNEIKIDVTNLGIGDSYRVSDIETDTLKILNVKSVPVVRVMITRASRSASGAATADGDAAAEGEESSEE